MSAPPAEIDIVANDDASAVFSEVSSNFSTMSSSMQDSATATSSAMEGEITDTQALTDAMNEAGISEQQVNDAAAGANQTFASSASHMNMAAVSGVMLYNGISNVENAQVSLTRANLIAEKAANDVTLAQ